MPTKLTKLTQEQYDKMIASCVDNCNKEYCFFKIFLQHQHPNPRVVCQFKCIEMFKWEIGEQVSKDVGFDVAGNRWFEEGYAEVFDLVYDEELSAKQVYEKTKDALKTFIRITTSTTTGTNDTNANDTNTPNTNT